MFDLLAQGRRRMLSQEDREVLETFQDILKKHTHQYCSGENDQLLDVGSLEIAHQHVKRSSLMRHEHCEYDFVLMIRRYNAVDEASLVDELLEIVERVQTLPCTLRPFFNDHGFDSLVGSIQLEPLRLFEHLKTICRFDHDEAALMMFAYFVVSIMGENNYEYFNKNTWYLNEAIALIEYDSFLLSPYMMTEQQCEALLGHVEPKK